MRTIIASGISALKKSQQKARRSQAQPASEALEDRVLLSNVTVSFQGGDLRLEGDSGDNAVTVRQQGDRIVVQGFNGTELNGRNQSLLFSSNGVPDDVIVNFQAGGENTIGFEDIHVGDDVQFRGGSDSDRLLFTSGSVADDMRIRTGNGRDTLFIDATPVGDSLDINTGSGSDKVGVGGDEVTARDVTIKTGRGRDGVLIGSMRILDDLNINTGSGNDKVFAGELEVDASGSMRANLSGGDDEAVVFESHIDAPVSIKGGSGTDGVEFLNASFSSQPSLSSIDRNFVPDAEAKIFAFAECLFDELAM